MFVIMIEEKSYFYKGLVLYALFTLLYIITSYARIALGNQAPGSYILIELSSFFAGILILCFLGYIMIGMVESRKE
jgi:hypothetical protein